MKTIKNIVFEAPDPEAGMTYGELRAAVLAAEDSVQDGRQISRIVTVLDRYGNRRRISGLEITIEHDEN